jgi:hypothetical protein
MIETTNDELAASLAVSRWTNMRVSGDPKQLDAFLVEFEKLLPTGWFRDRKMEREISSPSSNTTIYLFVLEPEPQNRVVSLVITRPQPNQLASGQWVPIADYHVAEKAIEQFLSDIFAPAVAKFGLSLTYAGSGLLEQELGFEVIDRLKEFARRANPNVTQLSREDRQRWNSFLIAAHQDDLRFDLLYLKDWLIRSGWSEQLSDELTSEYYRARHLLGEYDDERFATWRR